MAKKQMLFKTKGMNRDLSVSAFNPEFAFENRNLRLSTNDGNTLLSWVNEKGPKEITLEGETTVITGIAIGTAVLNNQLVIFTTTNSNKDASGTDRIYVLTYTSKEEPKMKVRPLYSGHLNFFTGNPLETLVSYEADFIQKVYWVDGRNQPRLINISTKSINNKGGDGIDHQFDFVPTITRGQATITQNTGNSGTFEPGVIQYCFTYYNKYGQQTNIVWVSPLYYLAHSDRGASPEDKVTSSFTITIDSVDSNFDFIRLYSIHRTSINADAIVKLLDDIPTKGDNITYTDNGTTGSIMDPYELLYVGGREIIANTMADKDDTLFIGNFTEKNASLKKSSLKQRDGFVTFSPKGTSLINSNPSGIYDYKYQLKDDQSKISSFKGGEFYRFGFQLQKRTGEWSEPVWIGDHKNDTYPSEGKPIQASATITNELIQEAVTGDSGTAQTDYVNIRPVIVYPTIADREVLCQGVLNPTVFNVKDRPSNSPYAQASWFFRPVDSSEEDNTENLIPSGPSSMEEIYKSIEMTPLTLDENGEINWSAITGGRPGKDPYEHDDPAPSDDDSDNDDNDNNDNGGDTPVESRGITRDATPANTDVTNNLEHIFTSVLVAEVDDRYLPEILARKTLQYTRKKNDLSTSEEVKILEFPFWGVIWLNYNKSEKPLIAFLSGDEASWPIPGDNQQGPGGESVEYLKIENVRRSDDVFSIPKLSTTAGGYMCYEDDTDTNTVTFTFEDRLYEYVVTFNGVTPFHISKDPNKGGEGKGSGLPYKHLSSLFTEDMAYNISSGSTDNDSIDGIYNNTNDSAQKILRRVEIQGSVRSIKEETYNSEKIDSKVDSNTQFFVDQSILTLNSPDLEFDTEVQTSSTGNLNLRIVGEIPITNGAADFDISTSSAMLELGHNCDDGTLKEDFLHNEYETWSKWNEKNAVTRFGSGVRDLRITGSKHLVSGFLWNDTYIIETRNREGNISSDWMAHDFLVFPWNRNGSIGNDFRNQDVASSWLKTKKMSNMLFSADSTYYKSNQIVTSENGVPCQFHLTENDFIENLRIGTHNYYPNIDKVLYNANGYVVHSSRYLKSNSLPNRMKQVTSPVSMKYKSTTHAVIDYGSNILDTKSPGNTPGLLLGELVRTNVTNRFGGDTASALRCNKWCIGGDAVPIASSGSTNIEWTLGDTYYQRYDCLKTYAFTPEDQNQIVEILSFMCETHVNIDGRYDRNRGQIDNTNMSPVNFNKLNPVYSQQNNFFTYRQLGTDGRTELRYPNQAWYSKTKTAGADVDLWTNVTLSSILSLDGDKGELNALRRFNNHILAFQDTGLSQVLYNENTVLSTQQGVPVEIANSNKVSGKSYISNTVGCSNKWSIVGTPSGLYFMDSNDKSIYVFNGQLQNLSVNKGFNTWCKQNIPAGNVKWNPVDFDTFTGFYDKLNQDVLWVNKEDALAYSEKLGAFTSFYDYGKSPFFVNLDDTGIWVKNTLISGENPLTQATLWKHQAGEYCQFFGENKPYWMTLVGNPEPTVDKIFTNLEFRASVEEDGSTKTVEDKEEFDKFFLPFDTLETWNEYQHGIANLQWKNGHGPMKHHLQDEKQTAHLNRKFRIWRTDIPRDNVIIPTEEEAYNEFKQDEAKKGIFRVKAHPIDRMRNPWLYLKLKKNEASNELKEGVLEHLPKTEVHDVMMTYY